MVHFKLLKTTSLVYISKAITETLVFLRSMALQSINSDFKIADGTCKSRIGTESCNRVIVNPKKIEQQVRQAVRLLSQDCVIAVATDTVYGLAAAVQSKTAIEKLYSIKGRDLAKPIAICVSCISDIEKWADTSNLPPYLLQCILPGPYTVVLKRSKDLNVELNPGVKNVGIRIPHHNFVVEIVKRLGMPIALTSANSSGEQSAVEAEEFSHLWNHLAAVFDDGRILSKVRTGSTVVDLSDSGKYRIIRAGSSCDVLRHNLQQFNLLECS